MRIRIARSGINHGDVKKRAPWLGTTASLTVDEVGKGVALSVGARVWCFGAQSYRAFGTAAEYVVLPEALVVPLPEHASFAPVTPASARGCS